MNQNFILAQEKLTHACDVLRISPKCAMSKLLDAILYDIVYIRDEDLPTIKMRETLHKILKSIETIHGYGRKRSLMEWVKTGLGFRQRIKLFSSELDDAISNISVYNAAAEHYLNLIFVLYVELEIYLALAQRETGDYIEPGEWIDKEPRKDGKPRRWKPGEQLVVDPSRLIKQRSTEE